MRTGKNVAWMMVLLLGAGLMADPARAATALDSWQRLESLITRRAYSVARQELHSELPSMVGEDLPRAQYWLGYVERRLGHGPAALEALRAIPSQSLWYARAQRELARELLGEGQLDEADAVQSRLIESITGPERDDIRLEQADSFFVRGVFDAAQKLYYATLNESADPVQREHAAYALGWCYERLRNPARATYSWKEALRLFPKSPQARPARMMLANQYLLLGKPLLASDEFRRLAVESADAEFAARAQFLAGEGYAAVKNWGLAAAAYAQVDPHSRWAEPAEYGRAFARWQGGDPGGARTEMERWLVRYPNSPTHVAVLYALGRICLEQGDHPAAKAAFERAIADSSTGQYVEASLFGLAELEYNANNYASCCELTRRLLRTYPDSAHRGTTRWLLAESLLALRQYAEAIAIYNQLAQSEPDLSFLEGRGDAVTFRLGLAHFRTGDFPAAASYLRQVVDGAYGQEAMFWLAEACYRSGDYAEAQSWYRTFRRKYPESKAAPEASYGEAYSAYQLRQYAAALPLFKSASEAFKAGQRRNDALLRLGALQLNAHEWAGALATYNALYDSQLADEHLPDVLFGLTWASYRKGNHLDCERWALSYLSRCPNHFRVNRVRGLAGQAAFKLGRFKDAVDRFEAILDDRRATAEEKRDAQNQIAACYFNMGQYAKAVESYQALYDSAAGSERSTLAQPLVQALLAKGDLDAARDLSLQASASAWLGDALGRIAQGYLDQGDAVKAVSCLTRIDSPSLEQRRVLADAYQAAGNPEAALATLDEIARQPGPKQVDWLVELGLRYLKTGNLSSAKEVWALVARLKPAHPALSNAAMDLASGYLKAGQDNEAMAGFKAIIARKGAPAPQLQTAWLGVGQIELKRGRYKEAIVAFRTAEKAAGTGLGVVQARYHLGATLVAAKRYEDAVAELTKLKVPADVPRVWEALGRLKLGEAYEHLRRWKDATALYGRMIEDPTLPEPERKEANDRLRWIEQNITRRPE